MERQENLPGSTTKTFLLLLFSSPAEETTDRIYHGGCATRALLVELFRGARESNVPNVAFTPDSSPF